MECNHVTSVDEIAARVTVKRTDTNFHTLINKRYFTL